MLKSRLKFSLFALMCFCAHLAFGQSVNPFEIEARKGEQIEETQIQPVDTSTIATSVLPDTTAVEEISFLQRRQIQLIEENPFNVSHIRAKSGAKSTKVVPSKPAPQPASSTTDPLETQRSETALGTNDQGGKKFLFWFFLIQLLLITSILGINREFIKKINRSISNDNFAKLVSRDYNSGYDALFAIMYIIFIISLGVFLYLATWQFYDVRGFSKFMLLLVSVAGVYLFRHFFLGFMGFVFPFTKTLSYYNFMIILFNSYLGLLLIPINVLMAYSSQFLANTAVYVGFALILIMYLLRFLRGSLYAYTSIRNHLFHFFLYLCICEIAPIFILVRFLSNSFSN